MVEIGLRCTTISDFYGNHHIVPNKMFINSPIENFEERNSYRVNEKYQLFRDSTPDQVCEMIAILKQAAKDTKHVSSLSYASFSRIGEYFMEVDYWFTVEKWSPDDEREFPDEYSKITRVPSNLRLNILKNLKKSKVKLAMPFQLDYMKAGGKSSLYQ